MSDIPSYFTFNHRNNLRLGSRAGYSLRFGLGVYCLGVSLGVCSLRSGLGVYSLGISLGACSLRSGLGNYCLGVSLGVCSFRSGLGVYCLGVSLGVYISDLVLVCSLGILLVFTVSDWSRYLQSRVRLR